MDFIVHTPDREDHFHEEESSYSLQDGVLIVRSDGKQVTYSPSFWQRITQDSGPPGGWVVGI